MENFNYYRLRNLLFVFISLFLIYSCSLEPLEQEEIETIDLVADDVGNSGIIEDQYVVLLSEKPGKMDSRALEILESIVAEVRSTPGARMKGVYKHALTGFAAKLTPAQVQKFQKDPRILSITPDRIIELESIDETSVVTVQEYPSWGLDRIDQRESLLNRAYSFTATGSGVNAYIVDSGIRYSHTEFEGRAKLGVDFVRLYPDEEYDVDDPEIEDGADCSGHGTHVAGTVGGKNFGVAKAVNLISVRVFSCRGITSESRVIQAVEWITANAIQPAIVNMSLGGNGYEPLDVAIENSIATGINYVLSAGNSNSNACDYSPARTPSAITVGASMIDNQKASFSNFGDCLDVYAPGTKIVSASHIDDSSVRELNGTSMAAPHVSGLTALYLEKNTAATPAQVHTAVLENATKDAIQNVPSGTTSLVHSLWETVEFTPPSPPDLMLKVYGFKEKNMNTIYLVWQPTEDPYVNIYRNGSSIGGMYKNTGEFKIETTGKNSDTFQVCEVNYSNCSAEVVPDYDGSADFEPNQPPIADFTYEINDLEVTFTDTSTDEDGTIIKWRLYFGDGYYTTTGNFVYTYKEPGNYVAKLTVTDNHEQSSTVYKEITVGTISPSPEEIVLSATGYKQQGKWRSDLSWTPAGTSAKVDIFRDGSFYESTENNGTYKDITNFKGGGSLTYKVCEAGTANCSNEVTVQF
ncbi:S8 family serine peptidase [Salinimicrobium xinjiangense]|uniref:S8 family serine peptidase n=1 Tax=Salinimicrobium xinjiangense TaxID=438596 RepID=UPI000413F5F8|nr:S8 family serine peptidase [Salinimicrobium xinjiangense]